MVMTGRSSTWEEVQRGKVQERTWKSEIESSQNAKDFTVNSEIEK